MAAECAGDEHDIVLAQVVEVDGDLGATQNRLILGSGPAGSRGDLRQLFEGDCGVYLGGREAEMPEQLLELAKVRASTEPHGGGSVPK